MFGCVGGVQATSPSAEAPSLRVRVLSWNVWDLPVISDHLDARVARIGPAIARLEPDLVALQELWEADDARRIGDDLRAAGLVHQTAPNEDTGLLIASRWPIEATRFAPFTLGKAPWAPWHVDWVATKGVVQVDVQTPVGPLTFADTHLQGRYRTDLYPDTRLAQALEVAEATAPRREGVVPPLVLAGDLNSPSHELPYEVLEVSCGLRPTSERSALDAVLVRDGTAVRVVEASSRHALEEVVELDDGVAAPLSDHPAVLAELTLASCATCGPVWSPGAAWPAVAARARATVERRIEAARADGRLALVGGIALLLFVLAATRRLWPSRVWSAGAFGVLGCVAAAWLLYLGLLYAPTQEQGMIDAAERIQLLGDVGPRAHR